MPKGHPRPSMRLTDSCSSARQPQPKGLRTPLIGARPLRRLRDRVGTHMVSSMPDRKLPRSLIRALEAEEKFPLRTLDAIREVREYLERLENDALCDSREAGASISEIADVMHMTRQSVYNRLKSIAERKAEEVRRAEEAAVVVPDLEEKK